LKPVLPVEGFVETSGKGVFGMVNGNRVRLGSAAFLGMEDTQMDDSAARVYIAINDQYRGCFTIGNQYRVGFAIVAAQLKQHFALYLLSGDNNSEEGVLREHFDDLHLRFDQTPHDKLDFIKELQQKGHKVMMIGDGLNDAGAFVQANVAASVADDIYHFAPASDIIVEAGRLPLLWAVLRFARQSLWMVKASFAISFVYNLAGLAYALSGQMTPVVAAILMPLSSVSVVAFAIFGTQLIGRRTLK
jgi:Cu+-exporting ATPase